MGEINEIHDSKHQRKAGCKQEQLYSQLQSVQNLDDEKRAIHNQISAHCHSRGSIRTKAQIIEAVSEKTLSTVTVHKRDPTQGDSREPPWTGWD